MLEAMAGRGFIDTVAVVTRYFGGTLLGAGGLARAYSDAVLSTIDGATTAGLVVQRERRELFTLSLTHAVAGRVESELRQRGVLVLGTEYAQRATLQIAAGNAAELEALVSGITAGTGSVERVGEEWVDAG